MELAVGGSAQIAPTCQQQGYTCQLVRIRAGCMEREKRRPRKSPYRRLWCQLQRGCQSIDIILTCASAGHWQGEAESRGGLYEELCKVDIAAACLINPTYHYIPFFQFPDWVYLSFSAKSVSAYLVNSQ